jgi:hypothetical protein
MTRDILVDPFPPVSFGDTVAMSHPLKMSRFIKIAPNNKRPSINDDCTFPDSFNPSTPHASHLLTHLTTPEKRTSLIHLTPRPLP